PSNQPTSPNLAETSPNMAIVGVFDSDTAACASADVNVGDPGEGRTTSRSEHSPSGSVTIAATAAAPAGGSEATAGGMSTQEAVSTSATMNATRNPMLIPTPSS